MERNAEFGFHDFIFTDNVINLKEILNSLKKK